MTFAADLELALELMDAASHLALDHFHRGVQATLKQDGTPVTVADRGVEQLLRDALARERPGDGLLGEELGTAGEGRRRWIIDPIDGTSSFAKGESDWRVQLALEVDGAIRVAVVDTPAAGLRWWAREGGGAFEARWPDAGEVRRLAVSTVGDPQQARIHGYPLQSMARALEGWRVEFPDSVVPYRVIQASLEAYVFRGCEAWDHAPWVSLVQEAGGRFTDWAGGKSAHQAGGIFSNAALHARLCELLIPGS